jgi:hypothetical protein
MRRFRKHQLSLTFPLLPPQAVHARLSKARHLSIQRLGARRACWLCVGAASLELAYKPLLHIGRKGDCARTGALWWSLSGCQALRVRAEVVEERSLVRWSRSVRSRGEVSAVTG